MSERPHNLTETFEKPEPPKQPAQAGPQALSVYPDAEFVARLLAGMPADIAASFSERQLFAIQQAIGPYDGRERREGWHGSIRMPWATYLISLRRERR
ncbi:MAG: hypothetical protein JWO24_916 [Rhodospirillales bacterium]|jgi:hypothetical protein|nr:hypothetical protein [Rhodospirillales bacterium]